MMAGELDLRAVNRRLRGYSDPLGGGYTGNLSMTADEGEWLWRIERWRAEFDRRHDEVYANWFGHVTECGED